ncbi:hypothetical protein [Psychromarinibacter sp. S121]|uniref:hypothetical protein n=1 Tax=Psychromarinibacter sp. S121 TaxID=3415127 RepID=UPI003C7DD543
MQIRKILTVTVALATITTAAGAESISGTSTIETRRGTIQHSFVTEIDSATGTAVRNGTLGFPNQSLGVYRVTATCDAGRSNCVLEGGGTGPMGIGWRGTGTLTFDGDTSHLTATLTSEKGREIRIDRRIEAKGLPEMGALGLFP